MVTDLTTEHPDKILWRFLLPMMVSVIFQQLYNLADSMIAGKFAGEAALAAVGASYPVTVIFMAFAVGSNLGTSVIVSRLFGAKDYGRMRTAVTTAFIACVGMSLLLTVYGLAFCTPMMRWIHTPEDILADGALYLRIYVMGLTFLLFYNVCTGIFTALGDSKTPLYFLIGSSIGNIVLDCLFVAVFHMGVAGVAVATILAQTLSALGCIVYAVLKNPYFRLKGENMKPDRILLMKCLRLGIPFGMQGSLIALSCIALQSVINRFGENVIAAFAATSRIEQLVQQPYNSLGTAVATFTAQNLGAGNIERVKRGYQRSTMLVVVFSLVMCGAMFLWGGPFVGIFVDDAEVIAIGGRAIRITSLFYIPLGMIYVARSLLNGAGDSFFAFANGLAEVVGRIGFSLGLAAIPALGYWAVWYTTGLTWLITGAVCMLRYAQGKWKKIVLVER